MAGVTVDSKLRDELGIAKRPPKKETIVDVADKLIQNVVSPKIDECDEPAAVEPLQEFKIKDVQSNIKDRNDTDSVADYKRARSTLYALQEMAGKALMGSLQVAMEQQSARGYEVVDKLINTNADLQDKLLGLNKKYIDLSITAAEALEARKNAGDIQTPTNGKISTSDILDSLDDEDGDDDGQEN